MSVAGVLSGALVWGLIWYPYRVLQEAGISGAMATMVTYLLAMMWGSFMLPRIWRSRSSFNSWAALLVLSAGWANFGYVLAMLHGEVMRILLLFYLAPLWTILFSYWLLGEHLNRYGYAVIVLSLAGAIVMLWNPGMGLPVPQDFSEWIGLSAGMGFALSNVVSRKAIHLNVETKSLSLWLGTALMTLPLLLWQGGVTQQAASLAAAHVGMMILMGLVLCATSFAVQYGVTHLSANQAAVLFLFELVVAAISSALLAAEVMSLRDWLGALLIVSAALLSGKMQSSDLQEKSPCV